MKLGHSQKKVIFLAEPQEMVWQKIVSDDPYLPTKHSISSETSIATTLKSLKFIGACLVEFW